MKFRIGMKVEYFKRRTDYDVMFVDPFWPKQIVLGGIYTVRRGHSCRGFRLAGHLASRGISRGAAAMHRVGQLGMWISRRLLPAGD